MKLAKIGFSSGAVSMRYISYNKGKMLKSCVEREGVADEYMVG